MKQNMGTIDQIVRLVIAISAAYLYYNGTLSGVVGIVAIVVAVIFLITSLVRFCPIYGIFGLSSRKS
ncbi:MAG: DUF2892 domain-containing protein [Bacteroidetes bacterium]|nr:DUF2892 domain-containing protein [Bacteroidota bacterium]